MNFQNMDLGHLILLWQTSDGNPELKQQIEIELQNRISNNSNFSREFIFDVTRVRNRACGIEFIPTSEAYRRYGASIVMEMLLTEAEFAEMYSNRFAEPPINTQGIVKARILVNGNLNAEQIESIANTGFHTRDIFETSQVGR